MTTIMTTEAREERVWTIEDAEPTIRYNAMRFARRLRRDLDDVYSDLWLYVRERLSEEPRPRSHFVTWLSSRCRDWYRSPAALDQDLAGLGDNQDMVVSGGRSPLTELIKKEDEQFAVEVIRELLDEDEDFKRVAWVLENKGWTGETWEEIAEDQGWDFQKVRQIKRRWRRRARLIMNRLRQT